MRCGDHKLTQHKHVHPSHLNNHDLQMIAVLGRLSRTILLVPESQLRNQGNMNKFLLYEDHEKNWILNIYQVSRIHHKYDSVRTWELYWKIEPLLVAPFI